MGARPDDELDFYDADLGRTIELSLGVVAAQTPDTEGALSPGRYLLQVTTSSDTDIAWVKAVPWVKSQAADVTAAVPNFPFRTVKALEFNVRKGANDRIEGIMGTNTGTLTITKISRQRRG